MSDYRPSLQLFPNQPTASPRQDRVIRSLGECGLIGAPLDDTSWLPGEEFLSRIIFLGCSPDIALHPDDGENFCRLRWVSSAQVFFLGQTRRIQPRCPHCKNRLSHWHDNRDIQPFDTPVACPQCGQSTPASRLNWRHEGGYASASLVIEPIHPHEAVPSEALLQHLQQASDCEWHYCYTESQHPA